MANVHVRLHTCCFGLHANTPLQAQLMCFMHRNMCLSSFTGTWWTFPAYCCYLLLLYLQIPFLLFKNVSSNPASPQVFLLEGDNTVGLVVVLQHALSSSEVAQDCMLRRRLLNIVTVNQHWQISKMGTMCLEEMLQGAHFSFLTLLDQRPWQTIMTSKGQRRWLCATWEKKSCISGREDYVKTILKSN